MTVAYRAEIAIQFFAQQQTCFLRDPNLCIRDAGRGLIALAVHRCRLAFEGLIAYVYADQFALIAENLGRVFRKIHTCLVNFRVH